MPTLTKAQHAVLDRLANVTRGAWNGSKVVGAVVGGGIVIRDGYKREYILERSGRLCGYAPPPKGEPVAAKRRGPYPLTVTRPDGTVKVHANGYLPRKRGAR